MREAGVGGWMPSKGNFESQTVPLYDTMKGEANGREKSMEINLIRGCKSGKKRREDEGRKKWKDRAWGSEGGEHDMLVLCASPG